MSAVELTYEDCKRILAEERLPRAFVNLDAFDSNARKMFSILEGSGKTMRVASKSLRCVDLLERAFELGGAAAKGVMSFTVEEADFLVRRGFDDILIAYPTARAKDFEILCALAARGADVSIVSDSEENARALGAAGRAAGVVIQIIVEVDMSLRPAGGAAHLGVRRSTVRTGGDALRVARAAEKSGAAAVVGIMGYEAQIAGMADENPFSRALNPARKLIREMSKPDVRRRRESVVSFLKKNGVNLRIVNGGGTGSLDFTSRDDSCTETTAGSGFYCPHLFSYYSNLDLTPAAFFALQASRFPARRMVACNGGGYVASGEAGEDRLPLPCLPKGAKLSKLEGAGEVQTPVELPAGVSLSAGDPVIFRHAKAGELAERFNELLLISNKAAVGSVPTYRGEGCCFL
jgi:D-serine deaminase-like pyridoxal phosphate-dependent protein